MSRTGLRLVLLGALSISLGCAGADEQPRKPAPADVAPVGSADVAPVGSADVAPVGSADEVGYVWDALGPIVDDEDGMLDASEFLASAVGFLPVAIPVTEPAVGNGIAGGVAFIHSRTETEVVLEDGSTRRIPPDISFLGGAYTENGTWAGAVGHKGHFLDDTIRYLGVFAYAFVNIDYYGVNNEPRRLERFWPVELNVEGAFTAHRLQFRLFDTNFFAGAQYGFANMELSFDLFSNVPSIPDAEFHSKLGALDGILSYDSLNNPFTPTSGYRVELIGGYGAKAFGGDDDFHRVKLKAYGFWELPANLFLSARAEIASTGEDAPLYGLNVVLMRGLPAGRYLGEVAVVGEAELRWQFSSRFSLVGFVGTGRAANEFHNLHKAEKPVAGGFGFRYLLARFFGLHAGIDVAFGPETTAVYFTVGNPWIF